jgi:hypothetical protein
MKCSSRHLFVDFLCMKWIICSSLCYWSRNIGRHNLHLRIPYPFSAQESKNIPLVCWWSCFVGYLSSHYVFKLLSQTHVQGMKCISCCWLADICWVWPSISLLFCVNDIFFLFVFLALVIIFRNKCLLMINFLLDYSQLDILMLPICPCRSSLVWLAVSVKESCYNEG